MLQYNPNKINIVSGFDHGMSIFLLPSISELQLTLLPIDEMPLLKGRPPKTWGSASTFRSTSPETKDFPGGGKLWERFQSLRGGGTFRFLESSFSADGSTLKVLKKLRPTFDLLLLLLLLLLLVLFITVPVLLTAMLMVTSIILIKSIVMSPRRMGMAKNENKPKSVTK